MTSPADRPDPSEVVHTVAVTGELVREYDSDGEPADVWAESVDITFTCTGGRDAPCHVYPNCECESWDPSDHEHPSVPHDECWLQGWFDNDSIEPSTDQLGGYGDRMASYFPADWVEKMGPIDYEFTGDWVTWSFADDAQPAAGRRVLEAGQA